MSNCFIATTKGFDEFFPKNLSVIAENRLYPIVTDPCAGLSSELDTVKVMFTYNANPKAQKVEVKGNWDDWQNGVFLTKSDQGNFRAEIDLPLGTHIYKFLVDGEWGVDNTKPIINHGGVENNIIKVETEMTTFSNMWPVRRKLNSIHKKIARKYPEFFLDEIVN